MKLESVGILVSLRPFGERDAIAHIFSRDFGVMVGLLRGAIVAKKNKPLVGQFGDVSWNARIDSGLGVFHWEPTKNIVAPIMNSPEKLALVNSVFDLVTTLLPEREAYEKLYDKTYEFLLGLAGFGDFDAKYLDWEISLIGELGYALDLSRCSGCGTTENLNYISPRTGRAVCDKCAAPYVAQLYKMPPTLDTAFKFLEKICGDAGISMPIFRRMIAHKKIE